MASLRDCLAAAIDTGRITTEESELIKIVADSEAIRISEKGAVSYEDAYQQAAQKAIDDFFEGKEIAKRQKVLQIKKVEQALRNAQSHEDGAYTGLMSLMVNDITGKANYANVDQLGRVIKGQYHAMLADMLQAYRPKNAGFSSNTEGARNIILEVFGHNTKNQDAKFYAESWKAVAEQARQRFNLAGGAIRKRKDWGMPQSHDQSLLAGAGYDEWYNHIKDLLDWEAMRAQYLNKIQEDMLGAASVKQAARETKAKLVDEYNDLRAREVQLKTITKNIEQHAAASPRIAKESFQELKAIRQRAKELKKQIDEIKITKTEKLEDLPADKRREMEIEFEKTKSRYEDNTDKILEGDLEPELRKTFEAIVTDGVSELEPSGMARQKGKLANRHSAARELIFKDGESWLKYHDRFGRGDIYSNMLNHIDRMSNEIALLEVLGPNPEFTFNYLRDVVKKEQPEIGGFKIRFLESVFKVVNGDVNTPASSTFADLMGGVRAMLVASKLGSAFLSAMSDLAFVRQASVFNNMETTKVLKRALKNFNPKNVDDKRMAVRSGLIADSWIDRSRSGNRFTEMSGSTVGGKTTAQRIIGKYADAMAKVSDITMRASLLAPWTEAGRHAFGMEFMGMLADRTLRTFDDLEKPVRNTFKRYGITPEDWEVMRKAKLESFDGVKFLRPDDLANAQALGITTTERNELVSKFMRMIITETDYAVPTPDARVQAVATMGTQRGSVEGELLRSLMMFKSFPVTIISQQFYRIASINGVVDKGSYIASMFLGTTVMGGVAYQLKELAKGREPLDMDNTQFWIAAVQQGGGLGIYGDFLFSDVNRYGGGMTDTIVGPVFGLLDDTAKLTVGNAREFLQTEGSFEQKFAAMNLSGDAIRTAKNYLPGASLWYARAAFERLVLEQAEMAADPQAAAKFQRLMRKRQQEYNQGYWWEPNIK